MVVQFSSSKAAGIKALHQRTKTAAPQGSYHTSASQAEAKQEAARQLLSYLGIGAAGGIGVRSLMGMRDMMQGRQLPVSASSNLPHTISVFGKPQHTDINDEAAAQLPMRKAAGLPEIVNSIGDSLQKIPEQVGNFAKKIPEHVSKVLPDTHTLKPLMSEWGIPAAALAAGSGATAGYKLTDWLLKQEQSAAGRRDVGDAEDDYRKALAEQYQSAMLAKRAGDNLGIDALADRCEEIMQKQAFLPSILGHYFPSVDAAYSKVLGHDNWQATKGVVNTAALGTMLGAGKLTYDMTKGQNKRELLLKALKRRQMLRQQLSPPPIIALPQEDTQSDAA